MKKKILYFVIVMLSVSASTQAQMFICSNDSCGAFDHTQDVAVTFADDSLWVGRFGYCIAAIDSIVFCHPSHQVIQQLGWWGNVNNGSSQYITLSKDVDGIRQCSLIVTLSFQAKNGICLAAHCEIKAPDDSPIISIFPDENTAEGDSYIYVKETQTGVRKLEVWVMNGPVLPNPDLWVKSEREWWADCGSLLAGRTMSEVQTIVETWLHEKGKLTEKSLF